MSARSSAPPCSLFPLLNSNDRTPLEILKEVDRGLQEPEVGKQCEAILFLTKIIAKFPFPIVVNTAVLKLASVFKNSPQIVRHAILESFGSPSVRSHLPMVSNLEQVLGQVIVVYQSNDPLARAVCLLTLGQLATIAHDRVDIHHMLLKSLQAQNSFEQNASIKAASSFSTLSSAFCSNLLDNLIQLLEGPQSHNNTIDTKKKLIPLFSQMKHSFDMTERARSVLLRLLEAYPTSSFQCLILSTLTGLADSQSNSNSQLTNLFATLWNDPRGKVKLTCLSCIQRLLGSTTCDLDSGLCRAFFGPKSDLNKNARTNVLSLGEGHVFGLLDLLDTLQRRISDGKGNATSETIILWIFRVLKTLSELSRRYLISHRDMDCEFEYISGETFSWEPVIPLLLHQRGTISDYAAQFLTDLVLGHQKTRTPSHALIEVGHSLINLLSSAVVLRSPLAESSVDIPLQCMLKLVSSGIESGHAITAVISILEMDTGRLSISQLSCQLSVSRFLFHLVSDESSNRIVSRSIREIVPLLLAYLEELNKAKHCERLSATSTEAQLLAEMMYLISSTLIAINDPLEQTLLSGSSLNHILLPLLTSLSLSGSGRWFCYKIACKAMVCGHLQLANTLLTSYPLLSHLRTEHFYYWVSSLTLLSGAKGDPQHLSNCLYRGLSSLTACLVSNGGNPTIFQQPDDLLDNNRICCYNAYKFQSWFVKLEIRYRTCLEDLKQGLSEFFHFISSTGDNNANPDTEYNIREIAEGGKTMRQLAGDYAALRCSCVDIDGKTQHLIEEYQAVCIVLGMAIDHVFPCQPEVASRPTTLRMLKVNIMRCTLEITKRLSNAITTNATLSFASTPSYKIRNPHAQEATLEAIKSLDEIFLAVTYFLDPKRQERLPQDFLFILLRNATKAIFSYICVLRLSPLCFPPFFFRQPSTKIRLEVQTALPLLPSHLAKAGPDTKSYIVRPDTHVVLNLSLHLDQVNKQKRTKDLKAIIITIRGYDANGMEVTLNPLVTKIKCKGHQREFLKTLLWTHVPSPTQYMQYYQRQVQRQQLQHQQLQAQVQQRQQHLKMLLLEEHKLQQQIDEHLQAQYEEERQQQYLQLQIQGQEQTKELQQQWQQQQEQLLQQYKSNLANEDYSNITLCIDVALVDKQENHFAGPRSTIVLMYKSESN